jgi:ADP-ribose pyrophosphatase YjhB (NUDIX family)
VSTIRPSGKAVIIESGEVLLTRNHKPAEEDAEFWLLPGGGQRHGEDLHTTVRREVLEETGFEVKVGELVAVRDYIGAHHELAEISEKLHNEHALELMFLCKIEGGFLGDGHEADSGQLEAAWVPLSDLGKIRLFPSSLAILLPRIAAGDSIDVYLGDIN